MTDNIVWGRLFDPEWRRLIWAPAPAPAFDALGRIPGRTPPDAGDLPSIDNPKEAALPLEPMTDAEIADFWPGEDPAEIRAQIAAISGAQTQRLAALHAPPAPPPVRLYPGDDRPHLTEEQVAGLLDGPTEEPIPRNGEATLLAILVRRLGGKVRITQTDAAALPPGRLLRWTDHTGAVNLAVEDDA